MNIVLLTVIIVLLIVCIILVSYLIFKSNQSIKQKKSIELDKFDNHSKIDFVNLKLPVKIERMEGHVLFQACYKVFESFRALDYVNKSENEIDRIEWHSWQVSLLLGLLKKDRHFFIPNHEKLFHKSILQSNKTQIEAHIKRILKKYKENVVIDKTRDELSNDIIWTSSEVSFIFYYMVNK